MPRQSAKWIADSVMASRAGVAATAPHSAGRRSQKCFLACAQIAFRVGIKKDIFHRI